MYLYNPTCTCPCVHACIYIVCIHVPTCTYASLGCNVYVILYFSRSTRSTGRRWTGKWCYLKTQPKWRRMKNCWKTCTTSFFRPTYQSKVHNSFSVPQPWSPDLNSILTDSQLADDKSSLLRLVSLLQSVVRVKGLEAQAAKKELRELQERI